MKKFNKNLSLIAIAALVSTVFFTGCEKSEDEAISSTATQSEMEANTVYMLNGDGFEKLSIEELGSESIQPSSAKTNNSKGFGHVNAHFSIQKNTALGMDATFQLNATENNNGVSGSGIGWITQTMGGVEYKYQVNTDAVCMYTEGNEAVVVGKITKVTGNVPAFFPGPGNLISIKVIDNGKGKDSPADQYNYNIIIHCACNTDCNTFNLNHPVWNFAPDFDVAKTSDYVNIR